ncbi:hypothetical protein RND81_01G035000 [Saponaria officinalis]|uniref:Uncharacterized protein n=1 Tax=Saponaria officinalis TaxID=3572 RepID=A0AAW1NDU3_SAPOF
MRADNMRKGPWYEEEDERLKAFVAVLGERKWDSIAMASGLRRSGKSCRLRWMNYLRPCLKHGPITPKEECLIIHLHQKWGNKWADIARRLPGRTDNEIKNYWRSYARKKMYIENDLNSGAKETSCLSEQDNNSNYYQGASSIECETKIEEKSVNNEVVDIDNVNHECTTMSSPYEDRTSKWISTLSREQSNSIDFEWGGYNGFDYLCDWSLTNVGSEYHCIDTLWNITNS